MENNRPVQKIIFAVVESADYHKQRKDKHYQLVDSLMSAGWGNNEGLRYAEKDFAKDKETLINALAT